MEDATSSADNNVCIGNVAGFALQTDNNTAVGHEALKANTTGRENTAFGSQTMESNTTGEFNDAFGRDALGVGSGFDSCCAFGNSALKSNTGDDNSAFGFVALTANTTGTLNTAVGANALDANTTGLSNTAVGYNAGGESTTASYNTFVGEGAAGNNTTGGASVAVGRLALSACSTGSNHVAVGADALQSVTTGNNNIGLGLDAGRSNSPSGNITTGSNQICLGNNNTTDLFCADTSISSSDSRDKTDVADFTKGLAWIEALRPVTYRWDRRTWYGTEAEPFGTPDGSKKRARLHVGFLAQEALEVEKANGYGDTNDNMLVCNLTEDGMSYGMKYERLVPILVNANKRVIRKSHIFRGCIKLVNLKYLYKRYL